MKVGKERFHRNTYVFKSYKIYLHLSPISRAIKSCIEYNAEQAHSC